MPRRGNDTFKKSIVDSEPIWEMEIEVLTETDTQLERDITIEDENGAVYHEKIIEPKEVRELAAD
jgi:hypothetical protein